MTTFDFSGSGVRSWLYQGMVTLKSPITTNSLKKKQATSNIVPNRKAQTSGLFSAFVMGISICTSVQAVNLPNLSAYVCSHVPELSSLTKQALLESLKSVALLGDNSNEDDVLTPSRQAIVAAEQIVPSLPNLNADASAGVDGDGNVFLKLQKGEKIAFLTIEPTTMHLLVMSSGAKNLYIDDVKFKPRQLPPKIRLMLEQEMVG